jgi:hypothetical protein
MARLGRVAPCNPRFSPAQQRDFRLADRLLSAGRLVAA